MIKKIIDLGSVIINIVSALIQVPCKAIKGNSI